MAGWSRVETCQVQGPITAPSGTAIFELPVAGSMCPPFSDQALTLPAGLNLYPQADFI